MYKFCENGDLHGVKAALGRGEDVNQIWQHGDCGNPTCADNPNCDFKALPLQGAIKGNHSNVVALLLKQPAIAVNLRTFVGYTALNVACMLGRTNIVRQLLFAPGIDPEIPNDLGRTALMEASFFGHTGCVSELMQCTMCCLLNRNSSGLLAPGDILKNPQKYLGKRHFFSKLTTRRKNEKNQLP